MRKWMALQIRVVGIVYAISFVSDFVSGHISDSLLWSLNIFGLSQSLFNLASHLAVSGVFYCGVIAGLLFWRPGLVGIDRHDLAGFFKKSAARQNS